MHPLKPSSPRPAAGRIVLLAAALLLVAAAAGAAIQSLPMAPAPAPSSVDALRAAEQPPMRIAERFGVEPVASMSAARVGAVDQLQALSSWNESGALPVRIGFLRPVPLAQTVRFDRGLAESPAGVRSGGAYARTADGTIWGTAVRVEDAYRLRLRLIDVNLPDGARLWVYAEDGETVGPFGRELVHRGELLTPSVAGPVVNLEVEVSPESVADGGDYGFRIAGVAEMVRLGESGEALIEPAPLPSHTCVIDASCVDSGTFPVIDAAQKAIAHLEFPVSGGFFGVCTGGLLNTAPADGEAPAPDPPLLTANHCFSDQAKADNLEAFWDYSTPSCDGTPPDLGTLPRSQGANLLATGLDSDYTLVGLAIPTGRVLLGWTGVASAVAPGTIVHRLSHPVGHVSPADPLTYARYETLGASDMRFHTCTAQPGQDIGDTTKFLHLQPLDGGTFGGSSGGPSINDVGQVVGQLYGGCPGADGCDPSNNDIDGAFQTTLGHIVQYLVGGAPPPPTDTWLTTGEQPGFEFQARITAAGGTPVLGAKEGDCIAESLCLSGALAGRPEVFVKLIGPRPNGFLWVQISRFTPSEVEVWVRQTETGEINYYHLDPVGSGVDDVSGLQDREAFTP